MPDLKQALKDFVATSNSGKYKDEKTLISKFPELAGYDIQTLKDYVATSNSGKYKDESTLNSKFPELFTQKKNPNANKNGVSNSGTGFSGFPKVDTDPYNVFPDTDTKTTQVKEKPQQKMATLNSDSFKQAMSKEKSVPKDLSGTSILNPNKILDESKKRYAKEQEKEFNEVVKIAKTELDPNLSEERYREEKNQSGILNNLGKAGKAIWNNTTGAMLSETNAAFGGDDDYFKFDKYKPLEDQNKQAKQEIESEGGVATPEAIENRAKKIFIDDDQMQQLHARVDANSAFGANYESVFKKYNLESLEKNKAVKTSINAYETYKKQIDDFNKYANYIERLPKEELTQEKIDKYNDFRETAITSSKGVEHLKKSFPKLLQEVKTNKELLELSKYNYNDFEKGLTTITNFVQNLGAGGLKILAETSNAIDQKIEGDDFVEPEFRKSYKGFADNVMNKNRNENEKFYHYKFKNINNWSDLGSYGVQLVTEQAPVMATLILAPEFGTALLGTATAGQTFNEMEFEETMPFAKLTTHSQKLWTSIAYGTADGLFEKFGSLRILKNIEKGIARASTGSRKLFYQGANKELARLAKSTAFNTFVEGGTERLTAEGQIAADRYIAGKDISTQQANEIRSESQTAGGLMGGGMSMVGGSFGLMAHRAKIASDNKDIQATQKILTAISALSNEIKNNPNLTKDEKGIIRNQMFDLVDRSHEIVTRNAKKADSLSDNEIEFLENVNLKQDELKQKFEKLKNSNISKEQKQLLTTEYNNEFNQLEKDRNGTLQGEFASIPDSRKKITFDPIQDDSLQEDDQRPSTAADFLKLPKEETTRLKNEAARELIKEKNPDGKDGNFTVTDEEITKRAIENYNKAYAQKQSEQTPTPEAQPQAEVQKQPEAEKVEELTDQEALDALDDTEEDNTETPTETVETPTETKPTLPELADQEYLDFVENDFLSDERLNDIAAKVLENKDLNTYEKRIAKKKEKEIVAINKKVQDDANETNRKAEVDTLSKIPAMEKDEFLEYTNTEKASEERLNSIAYKTANNIELNNFEAEVYQDNKKAVDKINRTKNLKENILDKVPSEQKYTTKDGKYTVAKNGNELELYDNNGQPVTLSPKTKQKYFLEALENGFMKRTTDLPIPEGISETEIETFEVENETDPSVILEKLLTTDPKIDGENVADVKDYAIAIYINKVTESSFIRFGDRNNITKGIALTYFSKDGAPIDTLAQEISLAMGIEVEPQDVVDFIIANPNGARSVLSPKNPAYQNLIDKFVELTGFRPTPSQIMDFKAKKEVTPTQIDIEFANEVEVNNKIADDIIDLVQAQEEFDKWFSTLTIEEQANFYFDLEQDYPNKYYQQRYNEQQEYEKSEKTTGTATPNTQGESKHNGSMGQNPQQAGSGKGNNNVPERESGETQTETAEQGVKPEIKLELVSAKDLVQSDDPITNKNTHNDIKERYKLLKSLIDCLFA